MGTFVDGLKTIARVLRVDGWQNSTTGLGSSRDKAMASAFYAAPRLSDQTLENLYEGDDMAARIVDAPIDDALRQGIGIKIAADEGEDADITDQKQLEADIMGALDELNAVEKIGEAAAWGRLYGGGTVWPLTDDPGAVDQPLILESVRKINSLFVLDKRDIYPAKWDSDPKSLTFGEPLLFQVVQSSAINGKAAPVTMVHASRLITFGGIRTSWRKKIENSGWSTSVLQRVYDALQMFHTGWQSTGHLLTDASQGVYKLEGLINMLASGEKDALQTRMQVVDMGRSVVRAIMLDAEKESYERIATSFAGIPDVLKQFELRLAAAAGMPLTVLMGQSPAGMNATGESDRGLWDDKVKAVQTFNLKPRIERLVSILMHSQQGPTKGVVPDNWSVTFPPLRQMTETETADLRGKVATADKAYVDMGAVTAEQVGLSRFGKGGWSMDTTIDTDLLKEVAEADKERVIAEAKDPPAEIEPQAKAKGAVEPAAEPAIE